MIIDIEIKQHVKLIPDSKNGYISGKHQLKQCVLMKH